jgi:hypothetical protein
MLKKSRNLKQTLLVAILFISAIASSACSSITINNEDQSLEESGIVLALDETYDQVRNGARLVLAFDAESNSFEGHVENTTDGILKQVRVEVHLSNGVELGPTTPTDLVPGESIELTLKATTSSFDGWTAHPEVGEGESGEHGDGEHRGEGKSEHDREGGGEHEEGDSG